MAESKGLYKIPSGDMKPDEEYVEALAFEAILESQFLVVRFFRDIGRALREEPRGEFEEYPMLDLIAHLQEMYPEMGDLYLRLARAMSLIVQIRAPYSPGRTEALCLLLGASRCLLVLSNPDTGPIHSPAQLH